MVSVAKYGTRSKYTWRWFGLKQDFKEQKVAST